MLRWEFELLETVHFDALGCIWCIGLDEAAGGRRVAAACRGERIRLRKNAPLPKGVVVRGCDDFFGEIAGGALICGFFVFARPLRVAHHGRAPR